MLKPMNRKCVVVASPLIGLNQDNGSGWGRHFYLRNVVSVS
jgi:hypothetical protein